MDIHDAEVDDMDKVVDQKPVEDFMDGEEDIDFEPSLMSECNTLFEQQFRMLYIVFGAYEIKFPEKYTPEASEMLLTAFQTKRLNLTRICNLLEAGGNPNTHFTDNFQQSLLHAAVRKMNLRAVRYLIDAGADVNALNTRHQTPLMLACDTKIKHGIHIVRYLVRCKGVNLHVRDAGGNSALVNAIFKENPDVVRVLLNAGCRALDERNGPSGWEIAQFVFSSGLYLESKHLPPHFVKPVGWYYKYFDLKGRYKNKWELWLQNFFKYDALLNFRILQRRAAEEEAHTALVPVKELPPEKPAEQIKAEADARAKERKVRELKQRTIRREESEMEEWLKKKQSMIVKVDNMFSSKIRGNMNDKEYVWVRDKQGDWHKSYTKKQRIYVKTPVPDTTYMTSNKAMGASLREYKAVTEEEKEEKLRLSRLPNLKMYTKEGVTADSMNWVQDKNGKWQVKHGGFTELGFYDPSSGFVAIQEVQAREKEKLEIEEGEDTEQFFHEDSVGKLFTGK